MDVNTGYEYTDNVCTHISHTSTAHQQQQRQQSAIVINVMPATVVSGQTVEDRAQTTDHSTTSDALSPLLTSLTLAGMYYSSDDDPTTSWLKSTISKIYTWFIVILIWLLLVKSAISFRLIDGIGPTMLYNLTVLSILSLCAFNACCCLRLSVNRKVLHELFHAFDKLQQHGAPFLTPAQMKKYVKVAVILCWTTVALNTAIMGPIIFFTPEANLLAYGVIPAADGMARLGMKVFISAGVVILSCLWVFPLGLALVLAVLLYRQFKLFAHSFESKINEEGQFTGDMELERRRYVTMTQIVQAADDCLAVHHGVSYMCDMIEFGLLFYCLIYYPCVAHVPLMSFAHAWWLLLAFVDITVLCVSGILVNSAVSDYLTTTSCKCQKKHYNLY